MRSLARKSIHLIDVYNARHAAATRFLRNAEFWARMGGRARWTCPLVDPLQRYNAWQYNRLVARAGRQWHAGLEQLDNRLGRLGRLSRYGDDALDLGFGVALDLFEQSVGDLWMVFSGDLTWEQYTVRMGIQGAGSVAGWGASWWIGEKVLKGTLGLAGPSLLVVEFVIGVGVEYVWDQHVEPWVYEQIPVVYPKSQRVGPTEPLPW